MANTSPENKRSSASKATVERLERDFMNATTPFDQWKVFQEALQWATTASELYDQERWKNTEGTSQ